MECQTKTTTTIFILNLFTFFNILTSLRIASASLGRPVNQDQNFSSKNMNIKFAISGPCFRQIV